jgi:exodeoxyribonuclease V alpha subunit
MSPVNSLLQVGALRVVDHALAQSLLRLRPDTPTPVLLAAALCSRALAQGHSQLPLARIGELLDEIAPEREWPELPGLDQWMAALRASPWVSVASPTTEQRPRSTTAGTVLVLEDDAISLRRYWLHEAQLAEALRQRIASATTSLDDATRACIAKAFPDALDEAQRRAAMIAMTSHLLLLTGGPGTGKTHTVARILGVLGEHARGSSQPLRIALAAPTGKAAARLAEAVRDHGVPESPSAQTLHRLLGLSGDGRPPRFDARHPLPFDVVVVDEASMVDLPMMARLLAAVPAQSLLIVLGDPDQLPSVEAGAVLGALCEASDHDALAAHHVHLQRIHRQTATLDIAPVTAAIRAGDGDAAIDLFGRSAGLDWRHGSDSALSAFVRESAVAQFQRVQRCADLASALLEAKSFRVLTALRDGPAGSQTLNALIARQLNPVGAAFFPGRLILVTENSYRHGLFNGDIGLCWPDAEGLLRVWFETDSQDETATRAWLPAQLPAHESAFALTVHKAQGSEFERIVLALPEHDARVISRELLYTGLSRGRAGVILWAGEPLLRAAIARKMARWNGLAARLR